MPEEDRHCQHGYDIGCSHVVNVLIRLPALQPMCRNGCLEAAESSM